MTKKEMDFLSFGFMRGATRAPRAVREVWDVHVVKGNACGSLEIA